ncbi:hypothetical protein PWG15_34965 (plasmid) [Ensifer adhaerens]|uniref:hypothetical protein n=1 Tax=Ensifer adhaerens TaxID=106592 RepID=UPI0023A918B4|nr:hypothetical protein [Ensifer adhaerens]WDZ81546.1 hypothetical protein PWG15_34965 [Ensifer adhaerens]
MQRTNPHQSSTPFWFFPSPAIPSVEVRGSLWPLGHLQATAIEAALRYQIEALKFLENRLNSDLRLLEDCQSPDHQNDLFDIWCTFWQNALFDYVNGGARFADMGSASIRKTTKRLHDDEKRFVENMAAQVVM